MKIDKWDYRFITLARDISLWSKDVTKVGAVIARPDNTICSVGFNGLPPGMDDDIYLKDRDFKNSCVVHAEENAIHHARDIDMTGYRIYVHGLPPCAHCSAIIATKNIKKVFSCNAASAESNERWKVSTERAEEVMRATGIEHYKI